MHRALSFIVLVDLRDVVDSFRPYALCPVRASQIAALVRSISAYIICINFNNYIFKAMFISLSFKIKQIILAMSNETSKCLVLML